MASRFLLTPLNAGMVGTAFPITGRDGQERYYLAFNDTTLETCEWTVQLPSGWAGTPSIVVTYRLATATTGTVELSVQIESISPADAINTRTTSSFDTANLVTGVSVPGATGNTGQITLTLTNHDTSTAGDMMRIRMTWPVSGTATGDVELLTADIRDTA